MGKKVKVLIVDDEAVVRESYYRCLVGGVYSVRTAFNGVDAIALMEEDPSDVVLVDLRMPGMGGIDLLRVLKERWPESEVVIITGYPSIESAKEALRLGAHNYLAKPVGPQEIVEVTSGAVLQKQWALKRDCPSAAPEAGKRFDYRYPWEN